MTRALSLTAHARATLVLGLPMIGSNLAQMGLHATDMVMVGWYGVTELAAVVIAASSFFVIFILGAGFAHATLPMVAQALGQGDETQVRRDARMGLWLSILYGMAVYPLFWWSGPVLTSLGQDPEVARLGQEYLRVAGLGMVPALMVTTLRNYLAAFERTQITLWVTVAAVGMNIVLNWMLIFGNWGAPELGVAGAAAASVGVQVFSLAALAGYAGWLPALRRFHLFQRFWRPDWPAFWQVFRLGWPIGFTGLAESGMFQASALMMGWIGTVELAAHGIAMEAAALAFMVHMGLSGATTVRTARYMGEGDAANLRRGAVAALIASLVVSLVVIAVFLIWPEPLIRLFLDTQNPQAAQIVAFGSTLLVLAALFQMADAGQVMALGLLRGIKDTRVPMILAAFSYWLVGIPASYVLAFPLGLGGVGLWLGLTAGLVLASVTMLIRFWQRAPRA